MRKHPVYTFWAVWAIIAAGGIIAAVLSRNRTIGFVLVIWGWIPAGFVGVLVRRPRPPGTHYRFGEPILGDASSRRLVPPPGSHLPSLLPIPAGPVLRAIGNVAIVADAASAKTAAIVGGGAPFRIDDIPIDLATKGPVQQIRAEVFKTYVRVLSELEGRLRPAPSSSPAAAGDPLFGLTPEMRSERLRYEQWLEWTKATFAELDRVSPPR